MHRLTFKSFFVLALVALVIAAFTGCASGGSRVAGGGSVDKEAIRNVVRSRTNSYMACYEGAIDVRPGAIGKVLTTWDIGPDGGVSNIQFVEVDPTIVDIKPCLQREISALKFSPTGSNEPVEVRYPFYFDERQSMTIDRLGVVAAGGRADAAGSKSPDGKFEVRGGASESNLGLSEVGDTESYTKSTNTKSGVKLPPDSTGETVPERAGDIAPSTTSGLPPASNPGAGDASSTSTSSTSGKKRANKSLSSKPSENPAPKASPVVMPLPQVISPSGN